MTKSIRSNGYPPTLPSAKLTYDRDRELTEYLA